MLSTFDDITVMSLNETVEELLRGTLTREKAFRLCAEMIVLGKMAERHIQWEARQEEMRAGSKRAQIQAVQG